MYSFCQFWCRYLVRQYFGFPMMEHGKIMQTSVVTATFSAHIQRSSSWIEISSVEKFSEFHSSEWSAHFSNVYRDFCEISRSHDREYEGDCSGMLRPLVWWTFTDISVMFTAFFAKMMEALFISETLVSFCETTRRNISEDIFILILYFYLFLYTQAVFPLGIFVQISTHACYMSIIYFCLLSLP